MIPLATALSNKELLEIKDWYESVAKDYPESVGVVGKLLGELSRYRAVLREEKMVEVPNEK